MSDEYTPTTEEVRADYVRDHTRSFDPYSVGRSLTSEQEFYGDRFDRWLAAHDAEVLAAAGVTQPEPEYEYTWAGTDDEGDDWLMDDWFATVGGAEQYANSRMGGWVRTDNGRLVRRVKAGAWEPVPNQTGEADGHS